MTTFLIWLEKNKNRTIDDIAETVMDAMARYAERFGTEANYTLVPIGANVEIDGVECVERQIIQWPHIQVGVRE